MFPAPLSTAALLSYLGRSDFLSVHIWEMTKYLLSRFLEVIVTTAIVGDAVLMA